LVTLFAWWLLLLAFVAMKPHLSALEKGALEVLAKGLRERFGARLHTLTLFGSRARGSGRDDSDLDVLVLIDAMSRDDRRAVQDLAADLGIAHHLLLSPLVADASSWRCDLPLARAIEQDGVAL
jgi:predicted nucleotidyltransferase